jgi:hypothetical protein
MGVSDMRWISSRRADTSIAIESQLATADILFVDRAQRRADNDGQSLEFHDNRQFWESARTVLRARHRIVLRDFAVLEWFPRSPGLFHTEHAARRRQEAEENRRWDTSLGAKESIEIYDPYGKLAMLEGGLGCLRLREKETEEGKLWFFTASSNAIAHEGIPIGVPNEIYDDVIDEIKHEGAVLASLKGELCFIPSPLTVLYSQTPKVPRLYLKIDWLEPTGVRLSDRALSPVASGAVVFGAKDRDQYQDAYVEFTPGARGNIERRIEWLQEYVSHHGTGKILTDFDEQATSYVNAVFSLRKIFDGRLDLAQISKLMDDDGEKFGAAGEFNRNIFVGNLQILTKRMKIGQANIGRVDMGNTITTMGGEIVMGDKNVFSGKFKGPVAGTVYAEKMQDSFNSFAARQPNEELQAAVSQLYGQVEDLIGRLKEVSPDQANEVAETLASFTDEVGKEKPNKVTLRALGNGIVDVAKKVAEVATPVATAIAAVLKLFGIAAL